MRLIAGFDGGGTRTRVALVDEDGKLRGYAEGGSCACTDRGLEPARQVLGALWRAAWRSAGAEPRPADALFLGLGSVLSEADARVPCELAIELGLAGPGQVRAANDAWNALAGGLAGRPGILLISGTGSACLGRNERGQTWRAGGWGYLLDDVGSAYVLGQAALIAATRDADGRGEPTALTAMVREALGLSNLQEIFRKMHHEGVPRGDVAALAPRVVTHAEAGDRVARAILNTGVEGLVEMVVTVARRLRLSCPELALTGGLITHAASFRELFYERLAQEIPDYTRAGRAFAPVFGAVMLALEHAQGTPPTDAFLDNLRRSTMRLDADP
jgi:N-acetylglucosamine kinase-like BadF-type ATPase